MFEHRLRFEHRRTQVLRSDASIPVESDLEVDATSVDLVECCKEMLSRLPEDLYKALSVALSIPLSPQPVGSQVPYADFEKACDALEHFLALGTAVDQEAEMKACVSHASQLLTRFVATGTLKR